MGLKDKLYKTYFKIFCDFCKYFFLFLQVIEVKFQLCCTGLRCVALLGRPFRVYEGWDAQLGSCAMCYVVFATSIGKKTNLNLH